MRQQRTSTHSRPLDTGRGTVVFDRDRPMFACPACGRTAVPTDDCVPDLVVEHECDTDGQGSAAERVRRGSV